MKVYIIKYALSRGIFEAEAETGPFEGSIIIDNRTFNRREWAGTIYEARIRAEQMKRAKIQALEKKLVRLETMDFATVRDYKFLKV